MPQCSAAQRARAQLANTLTASTASLYSSFFLWKIQSPPTHLTMAHAYISDLPVVERTSTGVLNQRKRASQMQHTRRWPPKRRSTPPPHVRVFLFVETMCGVPASAPHDVLRRHTSGEAPVPEIRSQSNNSSPGDEFK